MTGRRLIPRLSITAYRVMRRLVCFICIILAVMLGAVTYLNLVGLPEPILRRIIQQVNASGIPVDVEKVQLSLYGWRAVHVRYYSAHPDDLDPIIYADEVYVRKTKVAAEGGHPIAGYAIKANDIRLNPSVQWCMGLPADSGLRQVEHLSMQLGKRSDGIVIRDGMILWGDTTLQLNGTWFFDTTGGTTRPSISDKDSLPFRIEPELYARFEEAVQALDLDEQIAVDIDFHLDAEHVISNRVTLTVETGAFSFRNMPFSGADAALLYENTRVALNHAVLYREQAQLGVEGAYDWGRNEVEGAVLNSITSTRLFLLLPNTVVHFLTGQQIQVGSFPVFELKFGPAAPADLFRKIEGSFAIEELTFQGLTVSDFKGRVDRNGSRLDLHKLEGEVLGQEYRADEVGSGLRGGTVSGSCFWDPDRREFGVEAKGACDPSLLLGPLSRVHIATNIISRFAFDGPAPQCQLELGACYEDWSSFFLKIQGTAENMRFHDVPFSSVSASADYAEGTLCLDRIIAKQGNDYINGTATLDFRRGVAGFDGRSSVNPATLENVIYPRHGIFSRAVHVTGATRISGQGVVDWRRMQSTSFSVDVAADRVDLPMAALDDVTVRVSGEGDAIAFRNATFNVYGGGGTGSFTLHLDPSQTNIPYQVDVKVNDAAFNDCLAYLFPGGEHTASGKLSGVLQATADFTRSFFHSANGSGYIRIRDGQLADLPLFHGFSSAMRVVLPSFKMFSINRLNGNFELKDGVIHSKDAYFDGHLISAKGYGSYSVQNGFDAFVQVQMLSDNEVSRVLRFFTDPLLKLFEVNLTGTFDKPEWTLNPFSSSK